MIKIALTIAFAALCLLALKPEWVPWRFNFTSSAPRGLYRVSDERPRRGEAAYFCLASSNPWAALAAARGYVGRGSCRTATGGTGLKPLLKFVAGLPGDEVRISADGLRVNGVLQPHSRRPARDSRGRTLPPSALRAGTIPAGRALTLSWGEPNGFDGRHFGLVSLSSLRRAEPVLTF